MIQDVNLSLRVIERSEPALGYFSVAFERPPQFTFMPGDWLEFAFEPQLRGGPVYSLSSSPTEPDLVITFRQGDSEIKRALQTARPGDQFKVVEYGNDYGFALNEHRASVLIAGGVGVAPFRSMLKEIVDTGGGNSVQLICLNQTQDFLFRSEFDEWRLRVPDLSITYIATAGVKRKDRNRLLAAAISTDAASFYVSGPPGMVDSTVALLLGKGARADQVKVDRFDGY